MALRILRTNLHSSNYNTFQQPWKTLLGTEVKNEAHRWFSRSDPLSFIKMSKSNMSARHKKNVVPSYELQSARRRRCFQEKKELFPRQEDLITDNKRDMELTEDIITKVNNLIEKNQQGRLFAIIHVLGKQYRVTDQDIIMLEGFWFPRKGEVINFDKILLLGSASFTLIGRPLLPHGLASVTATVVEKDLSHTRHHFRMLKRKQYKRLNFDRREITTLRINSVDVSPRVDEIPEMREINRC